MIRKIPRTANAIEKKLKKINLVDISTVEDAIYYCKLCIALIDKSVEELKPRIETDKMAAMMYNKYMSLRPKWEERIKRFESNNTEEKEEKTINQTDL